MIILVAGSDTWRVEQDIARLKTHFIEKFDQSQLNIVDGRLSDTADELMSSIRSMPFLSDRRLVIVRDIDIETNKEQILFFAQNTPEYTVLILHFNIVSTEMSVIEGVFVDKEIKTHYYDVSENVTVTDIQQIASHYGLRLSQSQQQELILFAQKDISFIHSLCATLKSIAEGGIVNEQTWRLFCPLSSERRLFEYVDALVSKQILRAYALCEEMTQNSDDLIPTWSAVYTQIRKYYALCLAGNAYAKVASDLGLSLFEQHKIQKEIIVHRDHIFALFSVFASIECQGKRGIDDMVHAFWQLTDTTLIS